MFSRLSVAIARRGAKTFQDLIKLIRQCYSQSQGDNTQEGARPQYARIPHMYAIREWPQPFAEEMHYLRDHHHFQFVRDENQKCQVDFKPWCSSTPHWDRQKWAPLLVFKTGLPKGIPYIIKPSFQAVGFGRLQQMVNSCVQKGILRQDEKELWDTFLAKEIEYKESYDDVDAIEYDDKFHKDELTYLYCTNEQWPVDELISREKPNEDEQPLLEEVLAASEAYEKGIGVLPAYTGRYLPQKQKQSGVIAEQDVQEVDVGMLVALDMEEYTERPLIGEVKEILGENVKIVWFSVSWTRPWTPAKKREGAKWVEWLEVVPKKSVILFDLSFTDGGMLRSHSVCHLKEQYGMA